MKHYKSIAEFCRGNELQPPVSPMINLVRCRDVPFLNDREFTADFYMIGFKKLRSGVIRYGRTKYDHENGSMYFFKPHQVVEFKDLELEEDGFVISFHEDFLAGRSLHNEIKKYGFFEYETNEALHLSPKEEEAMWDLFSRMQNENNSNTDEFSRDILLTLLDSLLKYSLRFYKRQFINRSELSGKTVSRFNEALSAYFQNGSLQTKGLPTVNALAAELHLSTRYLSDLLKQETGKTSIELIHIYLINEAKNLLKGEDQSVSEIAYELGFDNLPYFSRLFKKEVGISPNQYKKLPVN